jgi:hypothetical protein
MTTKFLRLSAIGLFISGATLLRAAIPPAENLLPSDTLAFVTVPDCSALRAANKTSPQMMFWNDSAMKPFHDKFMAKFNEKLIAPLEKDLGINVDDFLTPLQGQFTLALTLNVSKAHEEAAPGLILLLDSKNQSDVLKTNLAKLTKKWTDGGRTVRSEKIRGLSFTVITLSSNDFPGLFRKPTPGNDADANADKSTKPTPPNEIYFTQYQSLLLAGNSAKAVDSVAARLTGGSVPVIADDAVFAADKLSQFRDSPTYYGWFNAAKFLNMLLSAKNENPEDEAAAMSPFSPAKILAATGLGNLKSASFTIREQPEGSTVSMHLSVPESARTGLLKIIALANKDAGIPAFVPSDAVKFTRVRLDGQQAWAELQKMVSSISPEGLSSINSVIDMANAMAQQKNPAFELRTYFFGNLRDDFMTYQKQPSGGSSAAFSDPPTLYLLAMANTDQGIDAIKTLAGISAPQDSANAAREFLGHKIYTIARPAIPAPGATSAVPNSVFLSSAGGYIALSKDTSILEEYLRSAEGKVKPLREVSGIAEAASHVGGMSGGFFSYENDRETVRSAFKLLKGPVDSGTALMFPPTFREWVDFSLLPDFEPVAKYFYITVCGANTGPDGMTLKFFAPRPPQAKQ